MSLGQFLDYTQMYENGTLWDDPTYRNYDLLWRASDDRLKDALKAVGLHHHGEISGALAELKTRVHERGFVALGDGEIQQCLLQWFVWQRISDGKVRRWPYRKAAA